ncbi:Hypothetical_protein [Hexamita inflata]|uniref:Hypothetical_protein n=1 Tax=Hexamita inflata TaxID=28002 RepID=A0AA86PNH1_9EUKA|nr:Hypothetical protein HINF_LOCUS29518 [Hexamita inflata]
MTKQQCFVVSWLISMFVVLLAGGIGLCFTKVSVITPFYELMPPKTQYDDYRLIQQLDTVIINQNLGVGIIMAIFGFFGFVLVLYVNNNINSTSVQKLWQLVKNQEQQPLYSQLNEVQQQQLQGKFAGVIQK